MTTRLALAVLLLTAALTACGGSSDPGSGTAPTDAGAAAARLAAADLDDFGCGYGFTVGTPDQTVRLSLFNDGGFGESPPPGAVDLGAAADWTAELVVGRDLFAQWCDDVMEPGEPEVVREAAWVVTGTLTWQLVEGDGVCPSVATATLTDGMATTDAGAVALPDLELRNEFFGCFAG